MAKDHSEEKRKALAALFPQAITETLDDEGRTVRAVDADALRRALGIPVAEGEAERCQLTWPGKGKSLEAANTPPRTVLRPCPAESLGRDGAAGGFDSENLYLQGDNLEVLKRLGEKLSGTLPLIYIDPPYNTGLGSLYKDSFGPLHGDWLNMLYPRLYLARELLREDGVFLASIDEREQGNLRLLCDEIFGQENFVECLVYDKKAAPKGVPPRTMVVGVHEYILCYAKDKSRFAFRGVPRSSEGFANPDGDPRGPWRNTNIKSTTSQRSYDITDPATGRSYRDTWAFAPAEMERLIQEGRILFPKGERGQVRGKEFFSEFKRKNLPIRSSLGLFDAQWNTAMLKKLMGGRYFPNPKHLKLMEYLIQTAAGPEATVLDFFSGSATTAHAVLSLNARDGGRRRFILVQLPEPCPKGSAAYRAGFRDICALGKERIRRASALLRSDCPYEDLDWGFRVCQCTPAEE